MIKHLQLAALISLVVTLCTFLYGAIAGYMNNYRMIIEVENRVAIIEAYRGRVTARYTFSMMKTAKSSPIGVFLQDS